jgi:UDP-N-acetylglucosamine acyltransferase
VMGIKRAYKTLYRSGLTLEEAKASIGEQLAEHPELKILSDFLNRSQRGIVR